jgi:hypothetical protein
MMTGSAYAVEGLKIISNGNVGIGTAAPGSRLHVVGDTIISGNNQVGSLNGYSIGGSSGACKIIATDQSGSLTLDNWLRVGNGQGILTTSNGAHFCNDANYGWYMRSPAAGSSSLRMQTSNGTHAGWYHAQAGFTQGFLNSNGNWAFNVNNSGDGAFARALSANGVIHAQSPSIYWSDGGVKISNNFGVYRHIYMHYSYQHLGFYNGSNEAFLTSAGAWASASDSEYKKDIADIDYGLETLLQMRPRRYKMKKDNLQQVGFVAQELESLVPELVSGSEGSKGIIYGQITAIAVKAIQEQQAQIDRLQDAYDELLREMRKGKEENKALAKRIEALENKM